MRTVHRSQNPKQRRKKFQLRTSSLIRRQKQGNEPLTPQFIVVGAATGFSTAVPCFTQVSSVRFGSWAIPRSPQQGQAATGVVLHHTPALLGLSPTPPLTSLLQCTTSHKQPLAAKHGSLVTVKLHFYSVNISFISFYFFPQVSGCLI